MENNKKASGFLVDNGTKETFNKVKLLLENPEPVNNIIGLKILEQGGIPKELMDHLLLLVKTNQDAKVRAKAKKMLKAHGPKNWELLLEDRLLFKNIRGPVKEQELNNKLKKIENSLNTEAAAIISVLLFEHFGKGLRFLVLKKSLPVGLEKRVYKMLVNKGDFDFSKGLGFKNWKGVPKEELTLFPYKTTYPFPVNVLKYYKVYKMNLHNTKLTGFPKGLNQFVDLKELDLSFNFLKKLSPQVKGLKKLEFLDLSYNTFEEFPLNLMKLPNLKKVDLRNNREKYEYLPLTIPEEVKAAMPKCEILV